MMRRFWAMLVISIGVYLCLWLPQQPPLLNGGRYPLANTPTAQAQVEEPTQQSSKPEIEAAREDAAIQINEGVAAAAMAAEQARTARTAADWDAVVMGWLSAIAHMQAVPANQPQRVYAQRKVTEYTRSLANAQIQAATVGMPTVFPPLGSQILDQQLAGYLSYLTAVGVPDVLIVGSSRALWGINPHVLEQALVEAGYADLRVYNLGINGATAQTVNFVLQRLLTPEQLPRLIVWADGSRAFNSARRDATFASILSSPGYQSLERGDRPSFALPNTRPLLRNTQATVELDANGFLPKENRFDPSTYYQQFPRVPGRYDNTYVPFRLAGIQTEALQAIATFTRSLNIPLVFVNLPLTDEYLDETRNPVERQFQQYLNQQSQATGFGLIDYLNQWLNQYGYFADPSHLNRYGAEALARTLAADYRVPWGSLQQQSLSTPNVAE